MIDLLPVEVDLRSPGDQSKCQNTSLEINEM